jgi:two-component system, NtrC family, C4-dicarboxylate transport response regulator DctD
MKCDQVRIFVVDDQPTIASTLADILRLSGFDTDWFTSPREALAAAVFDCPDLIISDIEMPHLSGIELAIRLKELGLECNILLVTGNPGYLNLINEANKLGYHFQMLQKPIGPLELVAEIRNRGWEIPHRELCPQFNT